MIDIYCDGGAYFNVMMDYDVLLQIMKEDFMKPDDFIEFRFENGDHGAVRKRSINGFCESQG